MAQSAPAINDGVPMSPRQDQTKVAAKLPEIVPKRPECSLFLPTRDERKDMASLVRAQEFLDCERDGFPSHLAPPWKTAEEGEEKLGNACNYFAAKSVRDYPQAGQANLQLAYVRCHLNVMQIILTKMVKDLPAK
jgi:hypothetical protein